MRVVHSDPRGDRSAKKKLVLLGGGHAHVAVLKDFGLRPSENIDITLISKGKLTPYSGMLPGLIAGHYTHKQAHIDLEPLARFSSSTFRQTLATGLDLENKLVFCADGSAENFDLLSVDIGSVPDQTEVPGVSEFALPVKPVDHFLSRWRERIDELCESANDKIHIVVVGGGAGGVELLLSVQHRLQKEIRKPFEFSLITNSKTILPFHNKRVQKKFSRILAERRVNVVTDEAVVEVFADKVRCGSGLEIISDLTIWVTHAAAPKWIARSGLATDERGFIAVNNHLQSTSHSFVFAVGDIATMIENPCPKAGVFAVRQGPVLTENLSRALAGEALKSYFPQKQFLSLISTGDQYAVASRGPFALEGQWIWKWKDRIDRKFIQKYEFQ